MKQLRKTGDCWWHYNNRFLRVSRQFWGIYEQNLHAQCLVDTERLRIYYFKGRVNYDVLVMVR